jgi:two-component system cell cycle response regulator
VLLDVQIPGGGGELVLHELRALASWSTLPVIAVTALAMGGDRERLLAAGFDGYLSKPIDTRTFGSVIESFLVDKEPGDDL